MASITFDTLSTSRRLRAKGFQQEQAEAIADEMRIASSIDVSHLATREEVASFKSELKEDLASLRSEITKELAKCATKEDLAKCATKEDLAKFATKEDLANYATKADLQEAKFEIIKWMFGGFVAVITMLAGLMVKLL